MKLTQTKTFCVFHNHKCRVGNIDADFNNRRGYENVGQAGSKGGNGGFLIACFDENVTDETITAIAKQKPYYFVMRDSSLASDSVATNFDQIFATYSPDTVRKVL